MPAQFGCILCTPDDQFKGALDAAISAVSNMELLGERNSASAKRSIYQTTEGRLILNVPSPHMLLALGPLYAVIGITVNGSPSEGAEVFSDTLAKNNIEVTVHHGLEPEMPDLSFVTIDEMPGIAFIMWPSQNPANAPEVTSKN